jgi:hypothetical protein
MLLEAKLPRAIHKPNHGPVRKIIMTNICDVRLSNQ